MVEGDGIVYSMACHAAAAQKGVVPGLERADGPRDDAQQAGERESIRRLQEARQSMVGAVCRELSAWRAARVQ